MNGLTAADFADTGQWRLILKISTTGMNAHLENTLHTDIEPQLLFSTQWEADGGSLLRNIENAVYDHPRVLDDFSAKIVIYDRKVMFIPTELVEDTDGAEETYYTSVFETEPADVMTESDRDITVAYCPAPGLKGFLNRTFPGARIGCNLMELVKKFRREGEGKRMSVEIRADEADFILLDDGFLISASTHARKSETDVVYHALNIMDVYGLSPSEVSVTAHADGADISGETAAAFEKFCAKFESRQ